jgi:Na+/H+ antiporter NhaD/arsenite permease-like protein
MNLSVLLPVLIVLLIAAVSVLLTTTADKTSQIMNQHKRLSRKFYPLANLMRTLIDSKRTVIMLLMLSPALSQAAEPIADNAQHLDLTQHWAGYLALVLFAVAYFFAMIEEATELRKSKPMVFAASLMWMFIASVYANHGMSEQAGIAFRLSLESYIELFLFILVSMTYLNAMEDRGVFDSLRIWLLSKNFTYRQLFWITGFQAFFISSVCNNLTTALLMGSVILAMGKDNRSFVTLSCINVVVAANAGGSFSPFGDITTLLVWQRGVVPFADFFSLFIPAVINFALPAAVMHFFIPQEKPAALLEPQAMKRGGFIIILLFALTIITATCFENFLSLPPAAGMMLGLTYLKFFSYYMQKTAGPDAEIKIDRFAPMKYINNPDALERLNKKEINQSFDVFQKVANLEWDTLLFFYGVMVCVGGLSFIGYLGLTSHYLYGTIDPTVANILVGIASAFVDNGTIMLAVLTMAPAISQGQWLLVTLTAGVGGSLLAVGSAAGVGLMGQAKGIYTFGSHLKWTPVILLGYIGSIIAHFLLNSRYF